MKPRTKIQIQVDAAAKRLHKISTKAFSWAKENCFEHKAYLTKKESICMECGTKVTDNFCPQCKINLKEVKTLKRKDTEYNYFSILSTVDNFQVIRIFHITQWYQKYDKAIYACSEIIQHWISEDGKHVLRAKSLLGSYYLGWNYCTPLSIKRTNHYKNYFYNIFPIIYPRKRILKKFSRAGFCGSTHDIDYPIFFQALLKNPHVETLLKLKKYDLMKFIVEQKMDNDRWPSIKICLRNKFQFSDPAAWYNYLDILDRLHLDTHNPKYICPEDINLSMTKYLSKIPSEKEQLFQKVNLEKKRFFDIILSDNNIKISPLTSIAQYEYEAKQLNHCLYSNEYFLKEDSLILSASYNNAKIATIELSLSDFSILQCRGNYNSIPEHNAEIMSLINNNINIFQERDII